MDKMSYNLPEIRKTFFEDPRWKGVEELLQEFIEPLLDIRKIDVTKDAEDVKAQVIGRIDSYTRLTSFLEQSKILGATKRAEIKNSPFR